MLASERNQLALINLRNLIEQEEGITSQEIQDQQSGGTLDTMYIALADMYGNIVGNTNSAKLTVRVDGTYTGNERSVVKYQPIIEGISQFIATAGSFNVSGISFSGTPGYKFSTFTLTNCQ